MYTIKRNYFVTMRDFPTHLEFLFHFNEIYFTYDTRFPQND